MSKKERARKLAIKWQHKNYYENHSYLYFKWWEQRFYAIAKKYKLVREFRENAII